MMKKDKEAENEVETERQWRDGQVEIINEIKLNKWLNKQINKKITKQINKSISIISKLDVIN